jgi:hypothetical protein
MEACASAHYWAREIEKLGHRVRLINPRFVRPYVKGNKNDASDAEAICEAAGRPTMRFVAVKTAAQQDVQAVHRVRQQLVKNHTALMNHSMWMVIRLQKTNQQKNRQHQGERLKRCARAGLQALRNRDGRRSRRRN